MKGLLHSKLFKQNLSRWLFMYIAVICLATSVITYSRYISKLQGTEEVRAAKFNVKVESLDCELEDNSKICIQGDYRSTSKIESHVRIKKEFEVSTTFVLNLKVSTDFDLNSISIPGGKLNFKDIDVDNYNKLPEDQKVYLGNEKLSSITKDDTYLALTFISDLPKGTLMTTDYTIETSFKSSDETDTSDHLGLNTINIGYSATQKD